MLISELEQKELPELIADVQRKVQFADTALVRKIDGLLNRFLHRLEVRIREDREEIKQNSLLKLFRYLPGYMEEGKFEGWLYGIVKNCRDNFYRRKYYKMKWCYADDVLAEIANEQPDEVEAEQYKLLQEALGLLAPQQHDVVDARFDQKEYSEISAAMGGIPVKQLSAAFQQGIRNITKMLTIPGEMAERKKINLRLRKQRLGSVTAVVRNWELGMSN